MRASLAAKVGLGTCLLVLAICSTELLRIDAGYVPLSSILTRCLLLRCDEESCGCGPYSGPHPSTYCEVKPPDPIAGLIFQDPLRNCSNGPDLIILPTGTFWMGCHEGSDCSRDAKPVRSVTFKQPIAMMVYEVTFDDWRRYSLSHLGQRRTPEDEGWGEGRRPVINISWDEASNYAVWLSLETGEIYRLPSESEWEYAARASDSRVSVNAKTAAVVLANTGEAECCSGAVTPLDPWLYTAPVGSYSPNRFGLHDMLGNVSEWVVDKYNGSYRGLPSNGTPWLGRCTNEQLEICPRRKRGGSWISSPGASNVWKRGSGHPGWGDSRTGFRLVREL